MITTTRFRVLLVSSVACELFATILSFTTEGFLPAEHLAYLQKTSVNVGEREIALLALAYASPISENFVNGGGGS